MKKVLAATALTLMFTGSAFAATGPVITLDDNKVDTLSYSLELVTAEEPSADNEVRVTLPAGTTITTDFGMLAVADDDANKTKYMRFDVAGGLVQELAQGDGLITVGGYAFDDGVLQYTYIPGDDSFFVVAVEVIEPELIILKDAAVTIDAGALRTYTLDGTSAISLTYSGYGNLTDAMDGDNALVTASEEIVQFEDALVTTLEVGNPSRIDVTTGNIEFENGWDDQELGYFELDTNGAYVLDGSAAAELGDLQGEYSVTVIGDFSPLMEADDNGDYAFIGGANFRVDGELPEGDITPNSLTFELDTDIGYFVYETDSDEELVIKPSDFSFAFDWGTDAIVADFGGDLASLELSGDTSYLTFANNPEDTTFPFFIRISNLSGTAGDVFIQLTSDEGVQSGYFNLADVEGYESSELKGMASTGMISMAAIYEAAKAEGFATDGDFKHVKVEINSTIPDVNVTGFMFSTDGNSFVPVAADTDFEIIID